MSSKKNINRLFSKYLDNACSNDELDQLIEYWGVADERTLRDVISDALMAQDAPEHVSDTERLNEIFQKVRREIIIPVSPKKESLFKGIKYLWPRISVAASLLVLSLLSIYFFNHRVKPVKQIVKNFSQDIPPGGNKAILTLADGKKIVLTDAKNGTLAQQGAAKIKKTGDGQVIYTLDEKSNSFDGNALKFNLVETPRGGKYVVTLPDGSKAWLDAASSMRFPVVFTGSSREVIITGQVYFEVAHDAAKPFRVTTRGQTVEVLGTHFNVNAYDDEPVIKTTLVEGSVKIIRGGRSAMLKPGQQASVTSAGDIINIQDVDVDEAIAWKNGYFIFENENIHSIMRKLSRWYDIEPDYGPNVSEIGFGGTVSRSKNISEVLKVLALTKAVHFKIEGRRIKVMP